VATVVRRIVDGGCFGLAWCGSAACEEALGEGTGASIRAIVGEESPAFGCLTKGLRAYPKLAWLGRTDFAVVASLAFDGCASVIFCMGALIIRPVGDTELACSQAHR
jgi:hypothetical protein